MPLQNQSKRTETHLDLSDLDIVTSVDEGTWRKLCWRRFDDIESQLKERADNIENRAAEHFEVIEMQTRKTNGRVSKLERFMWMVLGGLAVISMTIVPLVLDTIKK